MVIQPVATLYRNQMQNWLLQNLHCHKTRKSLHCGQLTQLILLNWYVQYILCFDSVRKIMLLAFVDESICEFCDALVNVQYIIQTGHLISYF